MLPKAQRYPLRADIRFFLEASRVHSPLFTVAIRTLDRKLPVQAAIIVPKKIVPTAIMRNMSKRWISATLSPLLYFYSGCAIVILVRKPFAFADMSELKTFLQKALHSFYE